MTGRILRDHIWAVTVYVQQANERFKTLVQNDTPDYKDIIDLHNALLSFANIVSPSMERTKRIELSGTMTRSRITKQDTCADCPPQAGWWNAYMGIM